MLSRNFVKILTHTWPKDSHELFDYESSHLLSREFKINESSQFYRNDENNVEAIKIDSEDFQSSLSSGVPIFKIQQDIQGHFYLTKDNDDFSQTNPELIVRGLKKEDSPIGYELKAGDNIKIGRVKFLVRELRDGTGKIRRFKYLNEEKSSKIEGKMEQDYSNNNQKICRICLMDTLYEDPVENAFLNPCQCKGSCEYVHLRCLKQWLDSKEPINPDKHQNHKILDDHSRKLACEVCKGYYPHVVKVGNIEYSLINLKRPENSPYMLLERIETEKTTRGIFLINSLDEELIIGRGHTSNILVGDISVSRSHAFIRYKEGKFMLFDNKSKFGTLVEIKTPIEISAEKKIIQFGKTVVILSLRKEKVSLESSIQTALDTYNFFEGLRSQNNSNSNILSGSFDEETRGESKLLSQSKKISKLKISGRHQQRYQS